MRTINVVFAAIIAFGVVYNAARISAAERSLEFGTLRVMGFTHAEISAILLGELAVLVLAAIPVGLVLGHFFAAFATAAMATETQRFPFFVSRFTYGFAAAVVLISALVSGSSVRRQLRRLDLVAVLKARD
jgi:putative ABC transport system permease protein